MISKARKLISFLSYRRWEALGMIVVSVLAGLLGVPVYYSAVVLITIFAVGSIVERRKSRSELVSQSLRGLAQQIGAFEPFVKLGGGARSMFSMGRSLPDNVEKLFDNNTKEEWLSRISASETNIQKRLTSITRLVNEKPAINTSQLAGYIDEFTSIIEGFKQEVSRFRTLAERHAFNVGMEKFYSEFVTEYNHFIGTYRNFLSRFKLESGVGVDTEIPFAEELKFSRWS